MLPRGILSKALLPMIIGTSLITAVTSWWSFLVIAERHTAQEVTRIQAEAENYTRVESVAFADVASNLRHLRRSIRLHTESPHDVDQFPVQQQADETLRLIGKGPDAGLIAWIAPHARDDHIGSVIAAVQEFGPVLTEHLPSVAVAVEGRFLVGWGAQLRDLVDSLLPNDPVLLPTESQLLQLPGDNIRWSRPFVEPATELWTITAILPLQVEDYHAASISAGPETGACTPRAPSSMRTTCCCS